MKRKRSLLLIPLVVGAVLVAPQAAHADDASYRTLSTASNPDWMRSLPDSRSLSALSIPGTHETLSILGGSLTQTQENFGESAATLTAQLTAGIRMIDVRARVNSGNTFTVHHGATYQNANFDDVLTKLSSFLSAHPGETVVLRFKQECTGELGSCTDASGQNGFTDIFDGYTARYPGLFWAPSVSRTAKASVPTLGAVRGKVVLAAMHGPRGGNFAGYGLSQFSGWNDGSSTYVQDNYTVSSVGAIATKRDQVRRFLDVTSAADPSLMYVNFASGSSLFAQPYQVAGGSLGVQGVNPFLLIYLNEGPEVHTPVVRTGVIMLDFPGGGLIDKIISYNI
ncbi:phosphatidylinositol-specific phospholipase C [Actinoplanes sp. NBRC 101535]|uniref:phosphatidylinositol-specific phospholipase C n=1 Tax=Actinoplanes sp. NBRC 101535 TaxID=3032196 RepID=UPI0024A1DE49|nr:phosphatidylinositol-specific phospholipase C [Actinoplanes sp. NBRC 101535]GLY07114.1 1-phosphatidylinositol phosphodiesterase [Actinoplanes sp. NBRC 101535]